MAFSASLSGVVQFATRLTVGYLYDRIGFKRIFNFLMLLNIINGLVCYQVKTNAWLYITCIELNYLVLGGMFTIMPASVIKTFGIYYGPQVYALILISLSLEGWYSLFIIKVVYGYLGASEATILAIGSFASFIAFLINWNFEEKIDFKNMNKRGLLIRGDP